MKQNNYDRIAPYYDTLSRLVFFKAQVKAQINQLSFIPANSNVLIIGGGTGWVLEEIAKIHPQGLNITYVEISEKMLVLSKKRKTGENEVTYIHAPAEEFKTTKNYEIILTAFLFDNFAADRIQYVFTELNNMLKPGGTWLFCDFYYSEVRGKKWQWYLLKTMYLFFNKISNVEAKALINTERNFAVYQYQPLATAYYYGGFIKAITYQKPG